jgi:hypothetical protein
MPRIIVTHSAVIDAPAATLYAIVADYHQGHPSILPKGFSDLQVEQGGVGASTVIRFRTTAMGQTREWHGTVSEPEPGRVLVEAYDTGEVTTFTFEPLDEGRTRVTFTTEWSKGGLKGWVERLLAPRMMRRMYAEEMNNLARVAGASSP